MMKSLIVTVTFWGFAFLWAVCFVQARNIGKRSAEVASDVDHETQLQRVKRLDDESILELSRVKRGNDVELSRVKRRDEVELTRVKRGDEAELSRVKRGDESELLRVKRGDEFELSRVKRRDDAELSRVKRKDESELSRVKRRDDTELSRVKREDESELSRVKRRDDAELSRVKRLGSFKDDLQLSRMKREQELRLSRMKRDLVDERELSREKRKDVIYDGKQTRLSRMIRDTEQGTPRRNRLDGSVRRFRRSELEQELQASGMIVKKDKPHTKLVKKKRMPKVAKPGKDKSHARSLAQKANAGSRPKVAKRQMGWWEKRARRNFFRKQREKQNKKTSAERKRNHTKSRRFHKASHAVELARNDKELDKVKSSPADSLAMKKRQSNKNHKRLTE
ncbi:trichohyalin-like [Gigantopelta aegis]|uniref:trichohyalin-like n=1 Tax=Gigantopelta aegis TaxID=1735272 RepID=UPI001B88B8CB|nr:trichohyalin-like [Gigantopelta aegis]